jgi:hypothetical protein
LCSWTPYQQWNAIESFLGCLRMVVLARMVILFMVVFADPHLTKV